MIRPRNTPPRATLRRMGLLSRFVNFMPDDGTLAIAGASAMSSQADVSPRDFAPPREYFRWPILCDARGKDAADDGSLPADDCKMMRAGQSVASRL